MQCTQHGDSCGQLIPEATLNPMAFIYVASESMCVQVFIPEKHFRSWFFWLALFSANWQELLSEISFCFTGNQYIHGPKQAQGNYQIKCCWFLWPCVEHSRSPSWERELHKNANTEKISLPFGRHVHFASNSLCDHMLCFSITYYSTDVTRQLYINLFQNVCVHNTTTVSGLDFLSNPL